MLSIPARIERIPERSRTRKKAGPGILSIVHLRFTEEISPVVPVRFTPPLIPAKSRTKIGRTSLNIGR